ncbi:hypothetical protein V8G54_035244 [Vigna mungo]|uniref:Transposase (putative) gypsy type domain-containing protein n=1 Tax=Vigna mungo TaxID=3915 RepID=A0AAQ3MET0_VIGMU
MEVVSVYSSEESSEMTSGAGGPSGAAGARGVSAGAGPAINPSGVGQETRVASPDSVSLSFLEANYEDEDAMPPSPEADRLTNGIAIFLLKDGVRVDPEMAEPADGWPQIRGYRWASPDMDEYTSDFGTRDDLSWWSERSYIAHDVEGSSAEDFFFVYTYMFDQMYVRVPFTEFQSSVLKELNVAPSQLHPNGWAAVQAFTYLCAAVRITPMVRVFLHYFNVRPVPRRRWVSLSSVHDRTLFKPFSDSFKNFKKRYFKIIIKESGRAEFCDSDGGPRFPFYWTESPQKIKAYAIGLLTAVEKDVVRTINSLPRQLSAHGFFDCLKYEDFDQIAFGYMSLPVPRQTGWLASSQRRRGNSGSQGVRRPSVASSSAPTTQILVGIPQAELVTVEVHPDEVIATGRVSEQQPPPKVQLIIVHSSESPPDSEMPLGRKRKSRAEGKSSSKKSRRSGSPSSIPLPAGIFDSAFDVASRLEVQASSSQRAVIEPLSEGELYAAAIEIMARGVMMAVNAREKGKVREGRDLLGELAEEQKSSAALRLRVESLAKDHGECGEKYAKLQADLEEAKLQLANSKKALLAAQSRETNLNEEVRKNKLEIRRLGKRGDELSEQSDRLTQELLVAKEGRNKLGVELTRVKEEFAQLDATVMLEHEEGFNKALPQVAHLLKVNPMTIGFDLYQDVYDGEMGPVRATLPAEGNGDAGLAVEVDKGHPEDGADVNEGRPEETGGA